MSASINLQQFLGAAQGHPPARYSVSGTEAPAAGPSRGVYSFCMCPGGQIVPTATDPTELCIAQATPHRAAAPTGTMPTSTPEGFLGVFTEVCIISD